jgi:uncharacterized membrane protein (UPF0127 family)
MCPRRWRRCPRVELGPCSLEAIRADSFGARLLGLAGLRAPPPGAGLLLPHTKAVHTFGMRFALDLVWLERGGRVVRVDAAVAPRRLAACRRAGAVLELPAGGADRAGLRPGAIALSEPVVLGRHPERAA